MFWYGFNTSYLGLFIVCMIFCVVAQIGVQSTFQKYQKVGSRSGLTGAEVARQILQKNGLYDVRVEHVRGNLTDHYDPRGKVLRLSDQVYSSTSIAALGVAAHETGHALQDAEDYGFLRLRQMVIPLSNFGSQWLFPIMILGMIFSGDMRYHILMIGVVIFSVIVLLSLITLPVEFNASKRALEFLEEERYLDAGELVGVKKTLSAAAMTYVAAAAMAIVNLLRLLALANRSRD